MMKRILLGLIVAVGLCGPALAQQNVHVSASTPEGAAGATACATDTASCNINQLLQRIAQNLTTLNTTAGGAIAVGAAIIGKVGIDQTTPGTTNAVQSIPATTGGLSFYVLQPLASDNHANVKSAAGMVYSIHAFNNSATINYMRLYNATSFNGCNSATNLQYQAMIPANSTNGDGFIATFPQGLAFATGIGICVTSGFGQTDTSNATASAMSINIGYK